MAGPSSRQPDLTIEDVDRALVGTRLGFGLPAAILRRWERDGGARRAEHVAGASLWFTVGYGLITLIEPPLLGGGFGPAAVLPLVVIGAVALSLVVAVRNGCGSLLRESGAAALTVVAVATTLWVFRISSPRVAEHYHYLVIVPILFGNVVVRPRFPFALAATVAASALHAVVLATSPLPIEITVSAIVGVTAVAVLGLIARHTMERELLGAWLRELRIEVAADRLSHRYDELEAESRLDPLTGVANRRLLDLHLRDMATRSSLIGEPLALLMLDVDHFKAFNDGHGHPAGDRCLARIARVAHDQIRRKDDMVGRFGGEEFLVILPGTGLADASRVAERLRAAIEAEAIAHLDNDGRRVATVSIGAAAGRIGPDRTTDDLVAEADAALYVAKRSGRNRVEPEPPGAAEATAQDHRPPSNPAAAA
jgi:diguanylate cyclase (GGDEF)-like protein